MWASLGWDYIWAECCGHYFGPSAGLGWARGPSGSKQRFSLLQEKVVIQAVSLRTKAVSLIAWF